MALLARYFPLNWFVWSYQSENISELIVYTDKTSKVTVQTKYPSLPFIQTSEIIVHKKCMRLLSRQNVPDYLHDIINQTNRLSLFVQKSVWPYSCYLIRQIFHLILFVCTVTVCSISTITVTSSSFGLINQVNTTIESWFAR